MNSAGSRIEDVRLGRPGRVTAITPSSSSRSRSTELPIMRRFLADALTTLVIALFMALAWVL
jgi:hypothetical protein